jgi:molybdopterin molybdotransferase
LSAFVLLLRLSLARHGVIKWEPMQQMITPDEALELVLSQTAPLAVETIAHSQSLGRTLAAPIVSPLDLPPFDNSAMDGYALRAADVVQASRAHPVELQVLETIAAGATSQQEVTVGTCARIMTGAPLPRGADAVVMREETQSHAPQSVQIFATASVGQNIRRLGSDVRHGEQVIEAGTAVRAAQWGMLASLGQAQVEVFRQPRLAIVTTGEELVEIDAELQAGQIRDSNSYALECLAQAVGIAQIERHRVGDDQSTLMALLQELCQRCDAIVTSGGVSAGDFDPVRDVLPQIAEVHFWKIAMKPGKPVMFATRQENERNVLIWGLPGNPVSVMVAWEQFVRPALLKMQGRRALQRVTLPATLQAPLRSPQGKVEFVRVRVIPDQSTLTGWKALVVGDQSSGRLSSMLQANALLRVPAEKTVVETGEVLIAQMTDWPEIE